MKRKSECKIKETMKLIRTKNKQEKMAAGRIRDIFCMGERIWVFLYLFCMFGIFPLYYKEQYYKIGDVKFNFFWKTTLGFLILQLLFLLIKGHYKRAERIKICLSQKKSRPEERKNLSGRAFYDFIEGLSGMDYAVLIYGICVGISYLFSEHKEYALKGAAGWEMGLISQVLFLAIYVVLSRQKEILRPILMVHLMASFLVYGLGILHRFEIDPLGMYQGLNMNQKIEFLSTIGQATWFSSYICTTFTIGVVLFYTGKKTWVRIVSGIYSVVSFGILATQNSDSAFAAIAGVLLVLGYYSLKDIESFCRFLQIFYLMWQSFTGMGILQRIFADRAVKLDPLSIFLTQSRFSWGMLFVSLAMLAAFTGYARRKPEQTEKLMRSVKKLYQVLLCLLGAAMIAGILFIYLNTKGYLLRWFGYQSQSGYLFFDMQWGNNRGSIWMLVWQAFWKMPFYQKLFGVGPDSLSAYLYSIPEYEETLHLLFGTTRLTNAHNEYLNSLMCYGIVGVSAWIGVLAGGIVYFYRQAEKKPYMIAFALCITGYACHNVFCYQQVCCTPFLFLLLGIGESLTKSQNFNTIK